MKLKSNLAFKAFAIVLLSGMFFIPMKGISQSSANSYALSTNDQSAQTDVSAYLVYDKNSETYTLSVVNPSKKKLKIYFSAGGVKYLYRASSKSFSKPFDLKGADDGTYTFAIQDGNVRLKTDVQIKTIHVTQREVRFASNSVESSYSYASN